MRQKDTSRSVQSDVSIGKPVESDDTDFKESDSDTITSE